MTKQRREKGEAPVIGPTEASGEATPLIKESNVTDSTDSSLVQAIRPETVPAITWEGARVITTELLARLYGTDEVRIRQNYARNADRFEVGKHFVKLEGEALRELKQQQGISKILSRARSAILWTERGAARHAKMLETDAAWEVFERLEDCYFTVKAVLGRAAYAVHPGQTLSAEQADTLRFMLTESVKKLPKEKQAGALVKGWSKLKAHFKTDYRHIPAGEFHEAVSILARHVAEWEVVDDKLQAGTLNETVAHLVKQVESPNGAPASIFLPLVDAVNAKMGRSESDRIRLAMAEANRVASTVQEKVFAELVQSRGWRAGRWLLSFNSTRTGPEPFVREIDNEEFVGTTQQLAGYIKDPNFGMENAELAGLASACLARLGRRFGMRWPGDAPAAV